MRALSSPSRLVAGAAIFIAACLVLGGAYFVGYVGEVQRALHDPPPLKARIAEQITALEDELGYDGFLKAYRAYRLTGESATRRDLLKHATESARILENLGVSYRANAAAQAALHEARAVVRTFAHIAVAAPETGVALRGTATMDTIATLPQTPQLETAYLSLRSALDRLIAADRSAEFGGAASALSWSQGLLTLAVAALVFGLVTTAALLQFGFTTAEKIFGQQGADQREGNGSKPARSQLESEIQALRSEIKDLSIRIAEDQILATAGGPAFATFTGGEALQPKRPVRTLADVPHVELQSRLKDLAAEMNAAQEQIAADLRGIAERTQSPDALRSHTLRDDAAELGLRSEALAARIDASRGHLAPQPSVGSTNAIEAAALDIAALADTIAEIEARAENLSRTAVAARFDVIADALSPAELVEGSRAAEQKTDKVVRTVFEAIERLNNIAAALARAGDAERQRKTAH